METLNIKTANTEFTAIVVKSFCVGNRLEYICYAQNRLFHYYKYGDWNIKILADYIVCPEWDKLLYEK